MIKFKTLSMRNFLSYGNNVTVFDLDRPGTTLIIGEDLDNTTDGKGANGVGKSAIINALAYAVYDRPISNIAKDKLVNNINKKNMEVTVEFTGTDGKEYKIHRTRKMKAGAAGNNVYLYIDGHEQALGSADATNAKILTIIGIPFELFVRIVVFSASHLPFLDLKQTEQTAIIEELFGLTMLSQKALALKEMIRDTEQIITTQRVRIDAAEREETRHKQQLASAKQRIAVWKEQTRDSIERLQAKLEKVEAVNVEEQRTLHETLKKLTEQLQVQTNFKREVGTQVKDLLARIHANEEELEHLRDDKCPRCKQTYADAPQEIALMEQRSEIWANELEGLQTDLANLTADVDLRTNEVKDIRAQITVNNLEELIQIKNESANIKTRIEELEQATNPYIEPLQELEGMEVEKPDYNEINKATKLLEHQQFLLKLLTKKDSFVRKALLNKNIPYLNSRLRHYLTTLGLPHKVEFTHEMTARISQLNNDLDFGNLSAGQRARVNFALSLAFKDVLQNLHTKINVCLFDEVLDIGLDSVGVQAAAKLLKQKARAEHLSFYIISHRDEIDRAFDRTLAVQLSRGFSYIKEEDADSLIL